MGSLWKVSHKDVPLVSSLESAGSLNDPFVPNDFAADGSHPMSLEISSDDGGLDEALFDFYMDHKVKCLKRKLSCAGKRNVKLKRSSDFPVCSTFHWIFREIFLRCCRWFGSNV